MNKIEPINITSNDKGITIFVPTPLLEHAANHHPDGIEVTNITELQTKVIFELENNLGSPESGLTGLQELLDRAIYEAAGWEAGCRFKDPL
jgi:predicted nucleotidyltransferase